MHPQFSYSADNTYTNEFDIQATATPSIIPPIPNQTDSPRASSSSISSPHSSTTTIPSSLRSNTSVPHPPNGLPPNHLFLSPMSYQPHNHYQQQGLQQQPDLPQSDFPSYPTPLEQSAYPHQLSAAEPSNKGFLGHFNPVSFETISPAQDYLMASSFDSEEVPQGWLWDTYQRAAMDSMLLDRTRREQEQQHCLPLVHTPGLSSSHSTALPSGLYAGDTFWHSNALELASRAAALASAPLMSIVSAAPVFSTTTPAFVTNDIAESSSSYHTMESSSSSVTVPSSSSQSSISATPGLLRPSRSDGVGRKSRRSSSKTSSSLTSSRRSGRSRSLVSSPRPPFLSDPNETFGLSLPSTIPSYSPHSLQLYHNLHHCLAHNCQGGGNFSPSLSCSATSSSPSPSISPQSSPISSFAHPFSRLSTVVAAKQDASITAPTPPAPTFVRLPPSMFQCPMEKCPKSFARAYNLHIHLKTQHHLASKELAAVSPLRAPPSAPPFQIITPEEVAAGTTMSDKDQPSAVQSGSKATNTTTSLTQSNPLSSTSADNTTNNTTNNNDGDNINNNNNNNNNNNGGDGMISGWCDASNGNGGDNGSLDCDSSCASPALGGTAAFGQGRSFACHLCPRIFSRKHDLHRHIRVHTGSKPYLCTNCHKAFARTDALCRHYKVEDDCRQVLMEVETASAVAVTESEDREAHQQHLQHNHQQR